MITENINKKHNKQIKCIKRYVGTPLCFDGCVEDVFDNENAGKFSLSGSSNVYKHTKL